MPPPGYAVISTIGDESIGANAALEASCRAASVVTHWLLDHWDRYENAVPVN
jgi:purine nucleoside permease